MFLKYLDGLEQDRADEAPLERKRYTNTLTENVADIAALDAESGEVLTTIRRFLREKREWQDEWEA